MVIASVDECKFLFELVLQFEKLTYCLHSVLFLKRVDGVEAFADLLLSLWVVFYTVGLILKIGCHILEFYIARIHALGYHVSLLVDTGYGS